MAPAHSSTAVPLHQVTALTVVWLRGDYDASAVKALAITLIRATSVDERDLIVDLSGVDFLGSACVGVLLRAQEQLRLQSRTLTFRSPSRTARRVLDLCAVRPTRLALVPSAKRS